ncbi:LysR family transcriptional regulator [Acuticoccus kandeliae]|uniref:LysR family transcriptional regulator n=1 Tax=Acuticoccus kandeliae TaxID=2073160 RepID=UPI000D3EA812|nr:LysR family transcriptional regulator [Acuticoccus kandeliae]
MELRHIRYFLAVADEGNFTRAAARLGIGQPPLSLQIKDLEREVGVRLFRRVPHGAELTEAGAAFYQSVKSLPAQAADAIGIAQRAARGETGELRVGFPGTAALHPLVPAAIRVFRRTYPEVALHLVEANSLALVTSLVEERLDLAILRPTESDPEDLLEQPLLDEPLVVALPQAHPAARRRGRLDLASLREEPLILTPRAAGTSLHDAAIAACRAAGFEPAIGQEAPQIASILSLVSAELGMSLVPASMRQLRMKGVVFRALREPAPRVGLAIAHRRANVSPLTTNFATLARTLARRDGR